MEAPARRAIEPDLVNAHWHEGPGVVRQKGVCDSDEHLKGCVEQTGMDGVGIRNEAFYRPDCSQCLVACGTQPVDAAKGWAIDKPPTRDGCIKSINIPRRTE